MLSIIFRICLLLSFLGNSLQGMDYQKAEVHPNNYSSDSKLVPSILHILYTGESLEDSLKTFANPEEGVSVHFLIAEDGTVYSLVPETCCAWHAGKSHWGNVDSVNKHSIGIALVNVGITDEMAKEKGWKSDSPTYPDKQIRALIQLAHTLVKKYDIKPWNVVGHSDVAPDRKYDPGLSFPWKTLAEGGVGLWPNEIEFGEGVSEKVFLQNLSTYGYFVSEDSKRAIAAFQAHFRPSKVDGIVDAQTDEILRSLLEKRKELMA